LKGIDISNYQAGIDLATLKTQGYEVVYIKATEGLTFNDKSMMAHYNNALKQGFKIGFYHYLRANDPVLEAKHFLSVINGLHSDCLYGIDAEQQSEATGISARTRAFADYLISQGKQPCLYTGLNFYNTEILPICKDIPLWVANYCLTRPLIKSVGWQCSQDGNLDKDIFDDGILLNKSNSVVLTSQPQIKATQTVYNIKYLQHELNIQCASRLVEDNIAGPKTLKKCPTVKHGANGNITRWLQSKLGISIDGDFGIKTLISVQKYQGSHKLQKDGIVGHDTWQSLLNL
jgi:hypothetical protein